MVIGDYGIVVVFFILVFWYLEVVVFFDLKSVILCKRVKCLFCLVSIVFLFFNYFYVMICFFFKVFDENVSDWCVKKFGLVFFIWFIIFVVLFFMI